MKKLAKTPPSKRKSSLEKGLEEKPKTSKTLSKAKKKASKQSQKLDGGLGPIEISEMRKAVRLVWQRVSLARAKVVKRCLIEKGFSRCELCQDIVAKIKVDHIIAVGNLDAGFLERLWCSSAWLQGICDLCHNEKTKQERIEAKAEAKLKKTTIDDII